MLFPSCSCFIGNTGVFFGAFLGPIFAILLFNVVIYSLVIRVLIKHSRRKFGSKEQTNRKAVIRLMISIGGVMALFGLMWVFAFLTFFDGSTVFQFLFAIFNSLQGFFIFLFFCVLGKEGRELWLQVLCCGRKIPGITVSSTQPKAKQQLYTIKSKPSAPSTMSTGLRTVPPTSTGSSAFRSSSITPHSGMFHESEVSQGTSVVEANSMALQTLEEESQLDELQSVGTFPSTERETSLTHSLGEESGTTADEQHNLSSPQTMVEVPDHDAVHLSVEVRRSSTARHHVETAELRFGDSDIEVESDSEVVANLDAERMN